MSFKVGCATASAPDSLLIGCVFGAGFVSMMETILLESIDDFVDALSVYRSHCLVLCADGD